MTREIPFHKIDKYISEKYKSSSMSDTKWKKLLNRISDLFEDGVYFTSKDIYGNDLGLFHRYEADDQFFAEPLMYKEVEWIEFPAEYEDLVHPNNRKAGTEIKNQDIELVRSHLNQIGQFDISDTGDAIRIYAYR